MACEYDEEAGLSGSGMVPGQQAGLTELEDEEGSQEGERKRKKRPNSIGTGRKKSDEDELSRANLVKRIRQSFLLSIVYSTDDYLRGTRSADPSQTQRCERR